MFIVSRPKGLFEYQGGALSFLSLFLSFIYFTEQKCGGRRNADESDI
jgi:hypothetical protein